MSAEFTFRTRIVDRRRPEWVTPGTVAFVAPRPLLGIPRVITPIGWAGEVSIDRSFMSPRHFADVVEHNYRMDAEVVVWMTLAERIAAAKASLSDQGYSGDELADLPDEMFEGMFPEPAPSVIEVDR